jgi:hypothetical protein
VLRFSPVVEKDRDGGKDLKRGEGERDGIG